MELSNNLFQYPMMCDICSPSLGVLTLISTTLSSKLTAMKP